MFKKVKRWISAIRATAVSKKESAAALDSKYALLAPICLSEKEIAQYADEFNFALNHSNAKNIALSGPYGAGKSSVALTIEVNETIKGRRWVHISLADFDGVSNEKSVEDELLNQLIYKVPLGSLSKSRLKPLHDEPVLKDAVYAALIVLFGLDTAFLLDKYIHGTAFSTPADATVGIAAVAWCALVGYAIYREIRTKSILTTFKRLKILNAEVELFDGESDTALDKYIDDIVYILKNSEIDVVVFEDIDRFDDLTIFEKLRRINDLANEGRSKVLRFFYLIKDSLFDDPHDRAKFFDFIIPVIPFVDPSNSVDLLKKGLAIGGINVDEGFLYQLSSFVDDPRILKEICNESVHYKQCLFPDESTTQYEPEKLVSIVSYKTIFPEDYENLQKGCGYVQSLFDKKEKFVDELIEKNSDKIIGYQEEINRIKRTLRLNENELQLLYLLTLKEFRRSSEFQYVGGSSSTEPSELFEQIRNNGGLDLDHKLEQIEMGSTRYSDRLKEVKKQSDAASVACKRKIEDLKRQSSEYSRMTLSDLIRENADKVDFFAIETDDLVREKDYEELNIAKVMGSRYFSLIRFLISQGCIDETYSKYMSNVYTYSMTPSDRDFVNSVLGAKAPQPEYRIENLKAVLIRLDNKVISRPSARNYSLLAELLLSESEEFAKAMLDGVHHDRDSVFVAGFLSSDYFDQSVLSLLDECYLEWPIDIIENSEITDNQKIASFRNAFSVDSFPCAIIEKAKEVGEFVSLDVDFCSAPISSPNRFVESLERVSFCPNDINTDTCDKHILGKIIEQGMYTPNAQLVLKLFNWKYKQSKPLPLAELNKTVCNEESGIIRDRILHNINRYISSLISDSQSLLSDDDETIQMILNSDGLSASVCKSYIGALANPISDLARVVPEEFTRIAIEANKVEATATNLLTGYRRLGFDESLQGFIINCGRIKANENNIENSDVKKEAQHLLESCLTSNDLDAEAVRRVASSFQCSFFEISLPDDKPEKIEKLLDLHVLDTTEQNLVSLRENYPEFVLQFVECDLESYINLVCGNEEKAPQCTLPATEAVALFEASDVNLNQKMKIAKTLADKIHLESSFPDDVNIYLIEKNLFNSFESLIPLYRQGSKPLKEVIAKTVESNPYEFIKISLPDTLEIRLFRSMDNASQPERINFVTQRISALVKKGERAKAKSILQNACLTNYVKLIDGPSAMIELTPEDDELLKLLTNLGMCGKITKKTNSNGKRKVSSLGYHRKSVGEMRKR